MNRSVLGLCCLLAFVLVLPSESEAARSKDRVKANAAAKKQVVLKAARAVPARMAIAARGTRQAPKPHGLLARQKFAPQGLAVRVAAQSNAPAVVLSRPVVVGDAAASPSMGVSPVARKSLPQRMYASDGDMFYFNGRKYRVEGVPSPIAKQEMTKQRLQQLLDSGEVSIEPRSIDDSGLTTAVIRVAGRDVAESLK